MAKTFGPIGGIDVGTSFPDREALRAAGVHAPLQGGISGNGREGADSVVVSGGYADDRDEGDVIVYTGHGGNDPQTKRQIADQSVDAPGNAGLITSQREGLPVRVVRGNPRGFGGSSDRFRYDGIFRVTDHWLGEGLDGFKIVRFVLTREDDTQTWVAANDARSRPPQGVAAPGRRRARTQRLVRSTPVADWVKKANDYRCQICGERVETPGGPYAEGAHIRALGEPHSGPDVVGNVLCLCPNDHVRFDFGAVYIDDEYTVVETATGDRLGTLRRVPSHDVDEEHIEYHRALWI